MVWGVFNKSLAVTSSHCFEIIIGFMDTTIMELSTAKPIIHVLESSFQ